MLPLQASRGEKNKPDIILFVRYEIKTTFHMQ